MITVDVTAISGKVRHFQVAERMLPSQIATAISAASSYVQANVLSMTPSVTGRLRHSIQKDVQPTIGRVYSDDVIAPYNRYVERGTRAGTRTTSGRFAFRGANGRLVVTNRIRHPGTKAVGMFSTAVERTRSGIRRIFEAVSKATTSTLTGS